MVTAAASLVRPPGRSGRGQPDFGNGVGLGCPSAEPAQPLTSEPATTARLLIAPLLPEPPPRLVEGRS